MPHIPVHPSAEKRHRQSLKRRDRNRAIKTRVHSAVKQAIQAIEGADAIGAAQGLRQATRVLCKAAGKGALHRNTVSRKVARLSRALHRKHGTAAKA
jgi:small subunit ribosomal protein S20